MARIGRVVVPGFPHHLTQRGNRRQKVFFEDRDYEQYLSLLAEQGKRFGVDFWLYCLMPNHVHLIAVPKETDSLARAIGEAHRKYTRMINFRENWRGYLWQGRFSSYPMDERYLLSASRYILRNPVRAGIVKRAEDYRWSSIHQLIGDAEDILLSKDNPLKDMINDWHSFIAEQPTDVEVQKIGKHERTGRPLGEEQFIEKLERILNRTLKPGKPGPRVSREKSNN